MTKSSEAKAEKTKEDTHRFLRHVHMGVLTEKEAAASRGSVRQAQVVTKDEISRLFAKELGYSNKTIT